MQILVVHHDAEVGEQLAQMIKDYTPHACELAMSESAALMWGRAHPQCRLLITELDAPEVDGLRLGGALSEIFPGLHTMFLPGYPAVEQRLEIADTKVFPEPIDGELLLNAIECVERAGENAPDYFHVLDVVQMCCLSARSGAVQLVHASGTAMAFLRDGNIVHAETTKSRGTQALFEICRWNQVEFAYDASVRSEQTISMRWDEALIQAVQRRKAADEALDGQPEFADEAISMPQKPAKRRLFAGLLGR
jgi:CheY-like chemotaxis protein